MSSQSSVDVEIRLKLKDGATAGTKQVSQVAQQEAAKAASATERAAQRAAEAAEKGTARQRSSYERMASARETIGVRSEHAIQREIQRTEAAYNRLAASGTLSMREQTAAADRMRQKVTELTNEMGKLTGVQKAFAGLRWGAAGMAGLAAAGYTLKGSASSAMSFDERIGLLSNTAFAERDKSGRRMGEAQIRAAVEKAIGTGMTRDAAMSALEKMVADDQVGGIAGAVELLPYIGKVVTGSGGASTDVASLMGSFINSGYARNVDDAKRLLGLSSAAATAGAFEKNDMAKHLPGLLPLAKTVGLAGDDGFRRLLVLLQQARSTAGSSDEAAINVKNLLSKLASTDTSADFKKAGRGDLSKYLIEQRAKGIDPLTAWQNVIDSEIAKNPNLKPAIAKIQGAKNKDEQDAAIAALTSMAEGQSMGKFFQDMQAKGALFGMRNRAVEGNVNDALRLAGSIVETDYQSIADRPGVQTRISGERTEMAKTQAMDTFTPLIGKLAEAFGDLTAKHPALVGTTMLATGALSALAGAAGLATVAMGGKVPGAGAIGRMAGYLSGPGAMATGVRGLGGVGLAAGGGYAVGTGLNWLLNKGVQAGTGDPSQTLGGWIYDKLHADQAGAVRPAEPAKMDASLNVIVSDERVTVRRQSLVTSGGVNAYLNTGNVHTGAPG